MDSKHDVRRRIVDGGVVAVLRDIPADRVVDVARAVHDGGVDAIELTADATGYGDAITAVASELDGTDAVVGAGTVTDAAAARTAIDAGAQFVFAPNVDEDVVAACNRAGVLCAPGVMTPTEATDALAAGADLLKLFPASTVGAGHVSAIRGPLGDVPIVVTGGVSAADVAEYFDAGAVAVGAGSALVDYDAVDRGDVDAVRRQAEAFVDAVERAQR